MNLIMNFQNHICLIQARSLKFISVLLFLKEEEDSTSNKSSNEIWKSSGNNDPVRGGRSLAEKGEVPWQAFLYLINTNKIGQLL